MNPGTMLGVIDSDSQSTLDVFHHEIHLGRVFGYQDETSSLAAAAKYYITILTPAGKSVHFKPVQFSTRTNIAKFRLYKDATYTSGTAKTPKNRNEQSANVSEVVLKIAATAGTLGTDIRDQGTAGTGGNPASARGGSALAPNDEIILEPSTQYVLEIENIGSSTATVVDWGILWYEKPTLE